MDDPNDVPPNHIDNACVNMHYTVTEPTPEEQEIQNRYDFYFDYSYRTTVNIRHPFYTLPSLRPRREPVPEDMFAAWDRVRIYRGNDQPNATGIIIRVEPSPPDSSMNVLHVVLDDQEDFSYTVPINSGDCYGIPWPQHEGRVYVRKLMNASNDNNANNNTSNKSYKTAQQYDNKE